MLVIETESQEIFNEHTGEFSFIKGEKIQLEHSLLSLSKWESKWKKPFLSSDKTKEEVLDYIKCMTINKNIEDIVYLSLTEYNSKLITDYISDTMTATTVPQSSKKNSRQIITAELIYFWMISQNIPLECQKWHLNRLLTLINVCNFQNSPKKKMSRREIMQNNSALNEQRKNKFNTKG